MSERTEQTYTVLTYRGEKLLDRERVYGTLRKVKYDAFQNLDNHEGTRVRIVDEEGNQVWERLQDA